MSGSITYPTIITFSNQKGGVGKTTLCACFANFLISKGKRIKVYDCDRQLSLSKSRQRDLEKNPEVEVFYEVIALEQCDKPSMLRLIQEVYSLKDCDYILFDCPGTLSEAWIAPLVCNSDYLLIPFHYDNVTIASTSEYILFVETILENVNRKDSVGMIFIPNLFDKTVGLKEERIRWEKYKRKYETRGFVSSPISDRVALERFSTIQDSQERSAIVNESFSEILNLIESER